MTTPRNNNMRDALLHLSQLINRKTTWLNRIKARIGLGNIAEKCLVKKLTPQEIESTRRNLCTNLIEQQVKKLQDSNATKINFYILLVQSIGDIIANEPITRHLKTLSPTSTIHWIVNKNFKAILEANPYLDEIIPQYKCLHALLFRASSFYILSCCRAPTIEHSTCLLPA